MGRLKASESDLTVLEEDTRKLLSEVNFFRFQNAAMTVAVYIKWRNEVRRRIKLREMAE